MKLWRLVLEADHEAWTFIVAATDPFVALELARDALPAGRAKSSNLEELEAIYDPPPGRAGVVQAWRDGKEIGLDVRNAPRAVRRKPTSARARSASAKVKAKTKARASARRG
jgi:hypothetical protein